MDRNSNLKSLDAILEDHCAHQEKIPLNTRFEPKIFKQLIKNALYRQYFCVRKQLLSYMILYITLSIF